MSRLDDLENLREVLIASINEAYPDKRAGLANQLRLTLAEIDELRPAEQVGDVVDDLAQRRAARRASASKIAGGSKRSG